MPKNKRLHYRDIPALRAIAFIPIYLFCILYLICAANAGILYDITLIIGKIAKNSLDFFFFLSAFLLTAHGLREYKYLKKFNLKSFIVRRVLRIGAILIFALLFTFLLDPWLIKVLQLDLEQVIKPSIDPFLVFVPNYFSGFSGDHFLYLQVVCTIYMFIQFYVFWGIVLKFLSKKLLLISIVLVCLGIVIRIIHFANGSDYFLDTLAYSTPIGIGSIIAIAMRSNWAIIEKIKTLSKNTNTFIYIIGMLILLSGYVLFDASYFATTIPVFTTLFFGYLIIEQTYSDNSFVQFKNKKILSYLGKISYGLIIYQSIIGVLIIIAFDSVDFELTSAIVITVVVIGGFIGSIIIADLSYNLFEKPLLRIRREYIKV